MKKLERTIFFNDDDGTGLGNSMYDLLCDDIDWDIANDICVKLLEELAVVVRSMGEQVGSVDVYGSLR